MVSYGLRVAMQKCWSMMLIVIPILLLSLTALVVAPFTNVELATIPTINQVAAYNLGDVVGEYKLEQRLDYLGTEWFYHDPNKQNLLTAPGLLTTGITAFEREQSTSFGYLTLMNEIRMDVNASCIRNGTFCLDQHIFRGGHGEVWRGRKISQNGIVDQNSSFILKRMHIKDRPDILRCALREIHFGTKLNGVSNVARYISHFKTEDDYWLVFMDEGVSLQKLLYSITMSKVSAILEPSLLWRKLRTSKGASSLRGIMQQIVASIATLHFKGITHRDVKPSNILLNTEAEARILMADFSSAISEESLSEGLYGVFGPLVAEETLQYAPPEVLLSMSSEREIPYNSLYPTSYDSWSVGVVFLEMILGTSDVFTVDQRTAAMITRRMKRSGVDSKETSDAMLLAAFADYCVYRRTDNDDDNDNENVIDDTGNGNGKTLKGREEKDEHDASEAEDDNEDDEGEDDDDDDDEEEEIDEVADTSDGKIHTGDTISSITSEIGDIPSTSTATPIVPPMVPPVITRINENNKNRGTDHLRVVAMKSVINQRKKDRRNDRKRRRNTHDSWHHHLQPMAKLSHRCGLEDLRQAILRRDPLGTGLNDRWGLDLLSKLLMWEPKDRIKMADALGHAYFTGPHISPMDGSEHATRSEAQSHLNHLNKDHRPLVTINADYVAPTEPSVEDEKDETDGESIAEEGDNDSFISSVYMSIDAVALIGTEGSEGTKVSEGVYWTQGTGHGGDFDENSSFSVTLDVVTELNFTCLKCGRSFSGDWTGCHNHIKTRKHGSKCDYFSGSSTRKETVALLPSCLSEHSMLPIDEHSGWCELQGRKRYMEDMHSVVFEEAYKLFAVFDGHSGNKAARFASKRLHALFDLYYSQEETTSSINLIEQDNENDVTWRKQAEKLGRINLELRDPRSLLLNLLGESIGGVRRGGGGGGARGGTRGGGGGGGSISSIARDHDVLMESGTETSDAAETSDPDSAMRRNELDNTGEPELDSDLMLKGGRTTVGHCRKAIRDAFLQTNEELTSSITQQDLSGTTAAVAVLFPNHLLVANVGDSRVVLCCGTVSVSTDGTNSTTSTSSKNTTCTTDSTHSTHSTHNTHSTHSTHSTKTKSINHAGRTCSITLPIQLTVDHTPYDLLERLAVESRGGFIKKDGVLRVNGKLAITRSIGDVTFRDILSSDPDVIMLRLRAMSSPEGTRTTDKRRTRTTDTTTRTTETEIGTSTSTSSTDNLHVPTDHEKTHITHTAHGETFHCSKYRHTIRETLGYSELSPSMLTSVESSHSAVLQPLFLILASDGLWDFVSGTEATELVCEFLLTQIKAKPTRPVSGEGEGEGVGVGVGTGESVEEGRGEGRGENRSESHNEWVGRVGTVESGEDMDIEASRGSLLHHSAMHDAARLLALEAFVRGSMDNVGVCIVDLLPYL